jgi:hypothetical protein
MRYACCSVLLAAMAFVACGGTKGDNTTPHRASDGGEPDGGDSRASSERKDAPPPIPPGRSMAPANAAQLLEGQFSAPADRPRAPRDTIAYINLNGDLRARTQIRLIQADGSDDRVLFEIDEQTQLFYRLWGATWRPDASELAFTSGHDEASYYVRDIYAITVDGRNLRRITHPPLSDRLLAYPSGAVEMDVYPGTVTSGHWWLYVEGFAHPHTWEDTGRLEIRKFTLPNVADYGDVEQRAYLRNLSDSGSLSPPWCYFGEAAHVNVLPAGIARVGARLPEISNGEVPCYYAEVPIWRRDGKGLLYLLPRGTYAPVYRLVSIESDDLTPLAEGRSLGEIRSAGQYLRHVALDPARDDRFLMTVSTTSTGRAQNILVVSASDASQVSQISSSALCGGLSCQFSGLAWHRDGSGFYVGQLAATRDAPRACEGMSPCTTLRFFDMDAGSARDVATWKGLDVVGFDFAPDMQRMVLQVSTPVSGIYDLWLYDLRTGESKLFLKQAGAAAWSPAP